MRVLIDVVVDRIFKLMGEQNLTQYKLAQLSGLSYGTVKNVLRRKHNSLNLKTIIMLADGLGMTLSEFFNTSDFLIENLDLDAKK